MAQGLSENRAQVDPTGRKPLLMLVVLSMVAATLLWAESSLLPDILFRGSMRNLWMAVIYGAMLLVDVYVLAVGLQKWWRRPRGEAALEHAAAQIERYLPAAPLVSHSRPGPRSSVILLATLPLFFLCLSLYGFTALASPVVGISFLFFSAALAFVFWRMRADEAHARGLTLTLDPSRKVAMFENFTFTTSFFPEKPRPSEEIPFREILDCTFVPPSRNGPASLGIVTTRGPTVLSATMENFDVLRTLLESIVTLNLADPEIHQANLGKVPKVQIPWFGWLICCGAFCALAAFLWMLLTKLR
jgi:hypothetical protein